MRIGVLLLLPLGLASFRAETPPTASRAPWPQWLGPNHNGTAVDPGAFSGREVIRLQKAWSHPLETGQAGLAVAEGHVFTLFTDGTDDYAIALSSDTGVESWRAKLDPGVERAFIPGPTSTPAYLDGRLFTLSSQCRLRAHDAATGRTVWEIDTREKFGTAFPMGCGPSPFVVASRLYVQTGGKDDHRIAALDPESGAVVWTSKGAEPASYASPVAADVGGVRQFLVHHAAPGPASGLSGFRLSDGALLWSASLPAGFSFDSPFALPGDRVGLTTSTGTQVLHVAGSGSAWTASPAWSNVDLQAAVSPPVFHAGHVFGYGGDDLVCVEAETGRTVWKQKLYPGSLILVDGHLVTLSTSAGLLRVVEATSSGYREKARLLVLNRGAQGWAPPSYSGRRIFVRNEEEVVAVDVR